MRLMRGLENVTVNRTLVRRFLAGIGALILLALAAFYVIAHSQPKLQARIVVEKADIGIPGVTKMYHAKLTNLGLRRAWVTRCDFVDDSMTSGTMIAHAVQRWDRVASTWTTISASDINSFCKPYPLGIVEANLHGGWLWPGQSLSTNEEATAGRAAIKVGDHIRFVVFTGAPGDYSQSVATGEEVLDEASTSDVPLRIAH